MVGKPSETLVCSTIFNLRSSVQERRGEETANSERYFNGVIVTKLGRSDVMRRG